jgi:hypothetical protein
MAHEIQASIEYFDKVCREKILENIKRRSSPSSALRESQRNRREEMRAIIDRGMADISKILEENLFQIQNNYKKEIEEKESHEEEVKRKEKEEIKECDEKEVDEKKERKEGVEEVERKEEKKESHNENQAKFWPTITLVPSSKLVCVFKCWDSSSNIIQLPNISLCHEGNKVNEETFSQQVEGNYEIWNDYYVHKSKVDENQANSSNKSEELSKVKVTCDGFYRFVFDPGGVQAINSRSNSLEEGEYDVILRYSPLTRIIKSLWNKRTKLFLVQIFIFRRSFCICLVFIISRAL